MVSEFINKECKIVLKSGRDGIVTVVEISSFGISVLSKKGFKLLIPHSAYTMLAIYDPDMPSGTPVLCL